MLWLWIEGCVEYDVIPPPPPPPPPEGPALEIRPVDHTFDQACGSLQVRLASVGTEDLSISGIRYDADTDALTLDHDLPLPVPVVLAPDHVAEVTVHHHATGPDPGTGILKVHSDDPRGILAGVQTSAATSSQITDTFPHGVTADVLLALDASGSMADDTEALFAGFGGFVDHMGLGEWHLGVVSDEDGCLNGGPISPDDPDPQGALLDALGFDPGQHDLSEALFALADLALGQDRSDQCNADFLRPGSALHIVAMSDEREQSEVEWSWWLEGWRDLPQAPADVWISAIVDATDPGGCSEYGSGYVEAAGGSGGLVLDLCSADWVDQLPALADLTTQRSLRLPLTAWPVVDSLEVEVGGTRWTDWTYDPVSNVVQLQVAPSDPGEIEVTYLVERC